ncbi:MAG: RnfABCDGE type electron transport complex subunit D [Spirochaetales bacterium]|jgi:electron transport complex protein RnfD|nr:RnfABCDGE type electron transport complex subunit D [Spirochaetales bacterium]
MKQDIRVSSSPQIHDGASTTNIMWSVFFCLVPSAAWGVAVFGAPALRVLCIALVSTAAAEALCARLFGHPLTLWDGSACVSGLLIGMTMPPGVPFYVPVFASFFAMCVVKWTFGGLGRNWMNPALAGRAFAYFSWTHAMTTWTLPGVLRATDALTGATPLGFLKKEMARNTAFYRSPMEYLRTNGYPRSLFDGGLTDWLNAQILDPLGITLPQGYVDFFFGFMGGSIGEVSSLLLLAGTVFLLARKVLTPAIPAAYFGTFGLLVWIFAGLPFSGEYFSGDVLFHFLSGGLILGAFYMATDIVSSPVSLSGQILYGCGAGLLTFLIRSYGSVPDGTALAILAMNVCVPLMNRVLRPSRFGAGKAGKGRPA